MIDGKTASATTTHSDIPLDDLERLVRGIDNTYIIEMVKHSEHLQRKVFSGYRPNHLPWDRVPSKLARDIQAHPEVMSSILNKWRLSNSHICELVKQEIHGETIEDDVVKILVSSEQPEKKRDKVFWALLLDEREEIQSALTNGLRAALINEDSALLIKVEQYRLKAELEKAKQDIIRLRAERDQLKTRNQDIPSLQSDIQRLNETIKQLESQHRSEISRRDKTLEEIKSERDKAEQELDVIQQKMSKLRTELGSERSRNVEIQRSMENLKNSLDTAVIASQVETSSTIKRQLHEALQFLEEERKVSALLRQHETNLQLSVERAERERSIAYKKRDEERIRRDKLEALLERTERAKEALISQVRKISHELEQVKDDRATAYKNLSLGEENARALVVEKQKLEAELHQIKADLDEMAQLLEMAEQESKQMLKLSQIDDHWNKAVDSIAHHISLTLSEQESISRSVQSDEKWKDWRTWQQMEETFIQPLLSSLQIILGVVGTSDLNHIESAQRLLTLRWYLLEWLKLNILEILRADNRALVEMKESGE